MTLRQKQSKFARMIPLLIFFAYEIGGMSSVTSDTDRFQSIISNTLKNEGGYVSDPSDPGGETKFGISKRSHPDLDIRDLSVGEAKSIYRKEYYEDTNINCLSDYKLTRKVFDVGVNIGPKRAITFLQSTMNDLGYELEVDGILGPKTLDTVNSHDAQVEIIKLFKDRVKKYYKSLKSKRFEKGWLRRLDR